LWLWARFEDEIEGGLGHPSETGEAACSGDVTDASLACLGAERQTDIL
jgi:hypothetical protein